MCCDHMNYIVVELIKVYLVWLIPVMNGNNIYKEVCATSILGKVGMGVAEKCESMHGHI